MHLTIRLHVDVKSSEPDVALGIGAVAERFGLAPHVLRHWEDMGLLAPARDGNGRRLYRQHHLVRVAVILRAKEAGLSLVSIAHMLTSRNPVDRRHTLSRQRDALAERIEGLQESLHLVQCALECEHDDIATCPHFQSVCADFVEGRRRPGRRPSSPGAGM